MVDNLNEELVKKIHKQHRKLDDERPGNDLRRSMFRSVLATVFEVIDAGVSGQKIILETHLLPALAPSY